jgi:hypothetical protein
MPERQDDERIARLLEPIQRDIARIPERDHEFTQFRRGAEAASNFRVSLKTRKVNVYRAPGPFGSP